MKRFDPPLRAAVAAGLLGAGCVTANAADYATVISATPVTSSVAVPQQSCVDVERVVQPRPTGAGALIGAIVGGVVGNQFGHGAGRAAATGLGAVAGSAIGNQAEAANYPPTAVPGRECRTVNAYENRVVGYDVVYEYNGQRYTTRMANDPGRRIAIDVRPAGAPLDRVGPPASGQPVPPAYVEAPPAYVEAPAYSYYGPAPYYEAAPVYYGAPLLVGPAIGIGIAAGWGWHHHRHWH